jgi:hypothetical protein
LPIRWRARLVIEPVVIGHGHCGLLTDMHQLVGEYRQAHVLRRTLRCLAKHDMAAIGERVRLMPAGCRLGGRAVVDPRTTKLEGEMRFKPFAFLPGERPAGT